MSYTVEKKWIRRDIYLDVKMGVGREPRKVGAKPDLMARHLSDSHGGPNLMKAICSVLISMKET